MPNPTPEELEIFNFLEPIRKKMPHAIKDEEQLRHRLENPLVRSMPAKFRKYQQELGVKDQYPIADNRGADGRILPYLYSRNNHEDPTYNWDLREMAYIPEGKAEIHRIAADRIAGMDMSHVAPENEKQACEYWADHMMDIETAWNVEKIAEGRPGMTETNPAFAEFLKYNQTLYQGFADFKPIAEYYASPYALALNNYADMTDIAMAMSDPQFLNQCKQKFPDSPRSPEGLAPVFQIMGDLKDPAWINAVKQLKEQGILGRDTRYQMAFNSETNERMKLDDAIKSYAKNPNSVRFQEMNEEQKKALDDAFRNPVFAMKTTARQDVSSAAIRKNCKDMYNLLDSVDSMWLSSNQHFSKLKKDMKTLMKGTEELSSEQVRQTLRSAMAEASAYIKVKDDLQTRKSQELQRKKNDSNLQYQHSAYTNKRIAAMQQIVDRISPMLGQMAYDSYRDRAYIRDRDYLRDHQPKQKGGVGREVNVPLNELKNHRIVAHPLNEPLKGNQKTVHSPELDRFNQQYLKSSDRLAQFTKSMPTAPKEINDYKTILSQIINSKDCREGYDLATVVAYKMIERDIQNGVAAVNSERESPVVVSNRGNKRVLLADTNTPRNKRSPLTKMLKEYGPEAFVRGVQQTDIMKKTMNELYKDPRQTAAKFRRGLKDGNLQNRLAANLAKGSNLPELERNIREAHGKLMSDQVFRQKHKPQAKNNNQKNNNQPNRPKQMV